MSALERLKHGGELERHRAAEDLSKDLSPEATAGLIEALVDTGVGEWPGDYDAPPFYYPVAGAAAESLAGRAEQCIDQIMAQTRVSNTAAFYVARMLGHLGQAGVEPLLELCQHPYGEARAQAVYSLRPMYDRCGDPRLIAQLLQLLVDSDSGTTYYAVGQVKELPRHLLKLAPGSLVEALLARCAASPAAGTFSEALDYFADDPRVFEFKVEQAAAGYERPCTLLLYGNLEKLSQAQVDHLCEGRLTAPLINLLGGLGERAVAAAPRLLELVEDPELGKRAVMALLAMPTQQRAVLDYLPEIYVTDHLLRGHVLRLHPDREALARAVLPRLAAAAQKLDGDAFRALEKFGSLAVGEAPWVIGMARLGVQDYFRDSAVELLGDFGEAARPAFPSFFKLLEYSSTRPAVLKALVKLGPVAAEFEIPLEVVKLESRYPKSEEIKLLAQALQAVRGPATPAPSRR